MGHDFDNNRSSFWELGNRIIWRFLSIFHFSLESMSLHLIHEYSYRHLGSDHIKPKGTFDHLELYGCNLLLFSKPVH